MEKHRQLKSGENHDINFQQSEAVNHAEALGSQDAGLTSSESSTLLRLRLRLFV